jgi:hypothetical protein
MCFVPCRQVLMVMCSPICMYSCRTASKGKRLETIQCVWAATSAGMQQRAMLLAYGVCPRPVAMLWRIVFVLIPRLSCLLFSSGRVR